MCNTTFFFFESTVDSLNQIEIGIPNIDAPQTASRAHPIDDLAVLQNIQSRAFEFLKHALDGLVGEETHIGATRLDHAGFGLELIARKMQVDFLLAKHESMPADFFPPTPLISIYKEREERKRGKRKEINWFDRSPFKTEGSNIGPVLWRTGELKYLSTEGSFGDVKT